MDIHIIPCLKDNYAYIIENKKTYLYLKALEFSSEAI